MMLFSLRSVLQGNQYNLFKRIFSAQNCGNQLLREPFSSQTTTKPDTDVSSDSDSDSDVELDPHDPRGKSEFWRRKMRTFHGILDINKDGVISFDDFRLLVDRFIYLGHLNPEQQKEFNAVVKSMWEERWGNISQYNLVTTEQYLEDMYHVVNDKQLRKKVHYFLPYLFKAVDKDKSGFITVEEYKLFFNCLGLPKDVAVVAFTAIDENVDGKLTLKEFVKTGRDFFLTEDQRQSSKMFWGPLLK